jgi:hypothetical protein
LPCRDGRSCGWQCVTQSVEDQSRQAQPHVVISHHALKAGDSERLLRLLDKRRKRADARCGGPVKLITVYGAGLDGGHAAAAVSPIKSSARCTWLGRPPIAARTISEIKALASSTELSVRQIQRKVAGKASRGVAGEITKRIRAGPTPAL